MMRQDGCADGCESGSILHSPEFNEERRGGRSRRGWWGDSDRHVSGVRPCGTILGSFWCFLLFHIIKESIKQTFKPNCLSMKVLWSRNQIAGGYNLFKQKVPSNFLKVWKYFLWLLYNIVKHGQARLHVCTLHCLRPESERFVTNTSHLWSQLR